MYISICICIYIMAVGNDWHYCEKINLFPTPQAESILPLILNPM